MNNNIYVWYLYLYYDKMMLQKKFSDEMVI